MRISDWSSDVCSSDLTTRHRIQGVVNRPEGQIVFVDTPGLHQRETRRLNRAMNEQAMASFHDVDLIVFVIEAKRWTDEDAAVLRRLEGMQTPVGLVVNKIDRIPDTDRQSVVKGRRVSLRVEL